MCLVLIQCLVNPMCLVTHTQGFSSFSACHAFEWKWTEYKHLRSEDESPCAKRLLYCLAVVSTNYSNQVMEEQQWYYYPVASVLKTVCSWFRKVLRILIFIIVRSSQDHSVVYLTEVML